MKLTTKFNIGDKVYCVFSEYTEKGKIKKSHTGIVVAIFYEIWDDIGGRLHYVIQLKCIAGKVTNINLPENQLFPTKKAALKELKNKGGK